MDKQQTWWLKNLAEYRRDGRNDAEKGYYDPPHPVGDDPQDLEENEAYREGFMTRRKELGANFQWR